MFEVLKWVNKGNRANKIGVGNKNADVTKTSIMYFPGAGVRSWESAKMT